MTKPASRPLPLILSGAAVIATLSACSGSSGSSAAPETSPSTSASPTATTTPTGPDRIYLSLPPDRVSDAKSRVADLPGVFGTRYAAGRERFYVYLNPDVTSQQRKAVEHALRRLLRG